VGISLTLFLTLHKRQSQPRILKLPTSRASGVLVEGSRDQEELLIGLIGEFQLSPLFTFSSHSIPLPHSLPGTMQPSEELLEDVIVPYT